MRSFLLRFHGVQLSQLFYPCFRGFGTLGRIRAPLGSRLLASPETADRFVSQLRDKERRLLIAALERRERDQPGSDEKRPTRRQLLRWSVISGVPFVGFGLVDNSIMIIAGEYIDITIGTALGISTMGAAALGNMVSDVSGLGLASTIEGIALRLGSQIPRLSPGQLTMRATRLSGYLGRAIGVCIGCFLGMFPLLFLSQNRHQTDQ